MPRVSVIMPSYNHGKYVAEAVQSVLDQTFKDFELIIVDDGSTDNTVEVIISFNDPRIRFYAFEKNRTASVVVNEAISKAKGEYIAILCSDDMFLPDKLEKQIRFLDENPQVAAVFGYAQIVDEDGLDFKDENHFYHGIFKQPNRTRFEWLNHFFYKMNCLCHPSILIRRSCYDEVGLYEESFAQLPDFEYWIRLCLKHEIHIITENLIKFRVRAGEANASGNRPEGHVRSHFEFTKILENYLKIESYEDLIRIFPETSKYGSVKKELIPFVVAMLAIECESTLSAYKIFGLDTLYKLMGDKRIAELLEKDFGFTHRDFIRLTGTHDIYNTRCAMRATELQQQLQHKDNQIDQKDRQIDELHNSMSWRITAPMRAILKLIK